MSRIRAAFLGTPDFARFCLEGLIKDEHFEVVGVLTQPDRPAGRNMKMTPSPVKALVAPLGIELLTPQKASEPDVIQQVRSWRAEVAIVVAYGQILSQQFLDLFPRKIVNLHTSLLPRWRGAAPIQRALMNGDRETGVSLQVMDFKLDAGDVLGARRIQIPDDMNALELHEAMKPLALELLTVDLMDYLRGNLMPVKQNENEVTIAHKISKDEARINWQRPAREIHNQVRGLAMGPAAVCRHAGRLLKIHRTRVVEEAQGRPGEVLRIDGSSFTVACGSQGLQVLEVQPESRARMAVGEYLKGHSIQVGDRLESLTPAP